MNFWLSERLFLNMNLTFVRCCSTSWKINCLSKGRSVLYINSFVPRLHCGTWIDQHRPSKDSSGNIHSEIPPSLSWFTNFYHQFATLVRSLSHFLTSHFLKLPSGGMMQHKMPFPPARTLFASAPVLVQPDMSIGNSLFRSMPLILELEPSYPSQRKVKCITVPSSFFALSSRKLYRWGPEAVGIQSPFRSHPSSSYRGHPYDMWTYRQVHLSPR